YLIQKKKKKNNTQRRNLEASLQIKGGAESPVNRFLALTSLESDDCLDVPDLKKGGAPKIAKAPASPPARERSSSQIPVAKKLEIENAEGVEAVGIPVIPSGQSGVIPHSAEDNGTTVAEAVFESEEETDVYDEATEGTCSWGLKPHILSRAKLMLILGRLTIITRLGSQKLKLTQNQMVCPSLWAGVVASNGLPKGLEA
ncbi:hypothetical protein U1Q18_003336, partial [Sarracenia purpurea var. burkii]